MHGKNSGFYSRRINHEHRLVYAVKDEKVDDALIAKYKQNISSLISKLIKRGTASLFTDNGVKFYKIAS